jgi:hypothetical protein
MHRVAAAYSEHDSRTSAVKSEILALERQAGNLSRAIRDGPDSETVRADLLATEQALGGLRIELTEIEARGAVLPPVAHPATVKKRLDDLERLIREDAPRARIAFGQHLIRPLPTPRANLVMSLSSPAA